MFASPGSIVFQIGPLAVRWYGLLIASGVMLGTTLAHREALRRGQDPDKLLNLIVVAVLSALIAISPETEILPYESVFSIVKNAEIISVAHCPCRLEMTPRGRTCDKPTETCMQFDELARVLLKRGVSRQVSVEEATEMLKRFEDLGLVHQTGNGSYCMGICNCCLCCCDYLRGQISLGAKNATAKSRFHAVFDESLCNGCGVCETRCHFDAIKVQNGTARCDTDRCFGCGLCHSKCETNAIELVLDSGKDHIPIREKNKIDAPGLYPLPHYKELFQKPT